MYLIESLNQYPHGLSLALEAIPDSNNSQNFSLNLTLKFNQDWQDLINGKVKLGFKKGELKLTLENCELLLNDLPNSPFQIISNQSLENAILLFLAKPGESILNDSISQINLGIVKVKQMPYSLTASFEVSPIDISITDAEGLWKHNISPNKHGILERRIAISLWENKLKSSLSYLKLASSKVESITHHTPTEISPEVLSQLKNMIESIYEVKTNDFLELIKLANLDAKNDLAGGNFVAAELSGIDFNGVNLSYANFRGANLTDADLSESNLSHSKLNGADLSGAYLEKANLSYTNLRNSSLALANLIEANLTGANLVGVNLSNASLNGAVVKEAVFGNNQGISEEMKQLILEGGGIFE